MARGYPRYNPGEFSVQGVLERREADACLLVGSETLGWLSQAALHHLGRIPTVLLDPAGRQALVLPMVRFTTGVPGIHLPGIVYRMDGVPLPLRPVLPGSHPSDAEVLQAIDRRLRY
jgi:formylmethanofuran dehydrogenase subunit B